MDRNTDRWWYDKGYSLGVTETQRDSVIPRLIGAWVLLAATWWHVWIALTFLCIYSMFELVEYRDRRAEAEHKRDVHSPGDKWEWD